MTLTQWLAIWFIGSVLAAPLLGSFLHKRRTRREFQGHLDKEARRVRLEKLVELADEFDSAETDKKRSEIYRRAEALGFCDDAFALDTPRQPDNAA